MLSDAFEVLRIKPDGGSDTLALETVSPPVSVLDGAFLEAGEDPLAVESCCHDRVLSVLTERDSDFSMAVYPGLCARIMCTFRSCFFG